VMVRREISFCGERGLEQAKAEHAKTVLGERACKTAAKIYRKRRQTERLVNWRRGSKRWSRRAVISTVLSACARGAGNPGKRSRHAGGETPVDAGSLKQVDVEDRQGWRPKTSKDASLACRRPVALGVRGTGVRCLPTTTYLERRGYGSARIHAATCSGPVGAR
jgi:hypothetical protein